MATGTGTIGNAETTPILVRMRAKDRAAFRECIDTYGNFVWALARRFARSDDEAETLTEEIFRDIWQFSDKRGKIEATEKNAIAMIALRRMIKRLGPSSLASIQGFIKGNRRVQ